MQERALLKSLAPIHVIVWMDILEIIVQQVRITKVFICIHTQVMFSFNVSHNIMLTGNHRTSIQVGIQDFFFKKTAKMSRFYHHFFQTYCTVSS